MLHNIHVTVIILLMIWAGLIILAATFTNNHR